ncbi:MAG: hypothetical protein NTV23_17505 [Propionibacteriales bacterium]|nr:hypothetical protein [Propionibacteriales bacterium]
MSSSSRSRGRLPARVYWVRRFLVLGTALALVFAFARLLTHSGSDGTADRANVVGAVPTSLPTSAVAGPKLPSSTARATGTPVASATPTVPAAPDGPCAADEVTVVPVDGTAPAGSTVPLVLQLSTTRVACTFLVSATSVVAKVSTANGKVWSSQDCPSSIDDTAVVVRSAVPTSIQISWSGRRSDGSCTRSTPWALPATYRVVAAAIGSEPGTGTLRLTVPERPVVVKTVQPKPQKKQSSAPTTPDTGH